MLDIERVDCTTQTNHRLGTLTFSFTLHEIGTFNLLDKNQNSLNVQTNHRLGTGTLTFTLHEIGTFNLPDWDYSDRTTHK